MIRKKLAGILAAIMVATTVFGSQGITVKASTLEDVDGVTMASTETGESTEVLENGTYEIANDVFKTDTTTESGVRGYIAENSIVTVEDGKITVTMNYIDKEIILSTDYITINGENVEFNENEDGSVDFEIESIDILDTVIIVGITYANPVFGPHSVSFDFIHKGDLTKIEGSDIDSPSEDPEVLEDGNYKVSNFTFTAGTDTESTHTRPNVETETLITVEDGKIYATMKYTDSALSLIKETKIIINEEEVNVVINEDETVTFEIPSIDTKVEVEMWVYKEDIVDHRVKFDLVNDIETLEKVTDGNIWNDSSDVDNDGSSDSTDEVVDGTTGASQNTSEDTESGTTEKVEADKTYTGKNEITSSSEIGKEMGRKAISEDMTIEEIGEKYSVTVTLTEFGSEQMSDIIVYVNGEEVETKSARTVLTSFSFELESLSDEIEISAKIAGMGGARVSFGVKVVEDSLVEVDNTEEETIGGTTEDLTTGTTVGTTSGSTEGTTSGSTTIESTTTTEEAQLVNVKVYSIENNVTYENETGVAMARMYLNATSKVEEIEGQYYVTLTFTGAEYMQNHEIYVNGNKVSISKSTSDDETYIRFAVGSLDDSIKVKMYVVPMGRDVEFGVELLTSTLTLIDEYTVETLPNTGAATSSAVVAGLGLILSSAGVVLTKKRK